MDTTKVTTPAGAMNTVKGLTQSALQRSVDYGYPYSITSSRSIARRCLMTRPRMAVESFIERARTVHGDKYDYSMVTSVSSEIKLSIICRQHGQFPQKPHAHLEGKGCPECANLERSLRMKVSFEEFVARARAHFGDLYDYSRVDYKRGTKKVEIGCTKCGAWFWITANCVMNGQVRCKCQPYPSKPRYGVEEFVRRASAIHGEKYDYSRAFYINGTTKLEIYCLTCNRSFWQTPASHLSGNGCRSCGYLVSASKLTKSTEEFIRRARAVHGDWYDYSKAEYKRVDAKLIVICPVHGDFLAQPNGHLDGKGCPLCKESKGEQAIVRVLDTLGVTYRREVRFDDCRNKYPLPFDFWLPELSICIEYQGQHHFVEACWYGATDKLLEQRRRDQIKRDWCKANGVRLIEVPYTVADVELYLSLALWNCQCGIQVNYE